MKKLCILVSVFATCAVPVHAKIDGCYFVKYDSGVFKRHPKLEIEAIALRYAPSGSDDVEDRDVFDVKFRNDKESLGTSIQCKGPEKKLDCELFVEDTDAKNYSNFKLTETASGLIVDLKKNVVLYGNSQRVLDVVNNSEHQRFTLKKDVGCKNLF